MTRHRRQTIYINARFCLIKLIIYKLADVLYIKIELRFMRKVMSGHVHVIQILEISTSCYAILTILGILGKLLLSFSVYSNAPKILNTNQPKGTLTCVNGIRFLSMTWVILGHTVAFGASRIGREKLFRSFCSNFYL